MELVLLFDHRFYTDEDGVVFSLQNYNYSLVANRYLKVFDRVRILARVASPAPRKRTGEERAEGPGVEVMSLGNWAGPFDFFTKRRTVRRRLNRFLPEGAAIIMIAPGTVGAMVVESLIKSGRPYGVEVVMDPHDVFAPKAMRHPLRPLARWWFVRQLRRQCAGACAAAYVTESALQARYPPAPGAFSTHYSSIELRDIAFVAAPREARQATGPLRIVTVGTMAQMYKGHDVLIDAVGICVTGGLDVRLVLVGGGRHQAELEERAKKAGLADRVCFRGQLAAGELVRAQLDQADLFASPSRQEGVPRAMIEAMARGLPCIGSTIGGIPELLPPEDMVPPNDARALAERIREVVADPERMARMSARNLEKAQAYREEILSERRVALYRRLSESTARWLESRR